MNLLFNLLQLPRTAKRGISLLADTVAILAALTISYCLNFKLVPPGQPWLFAAIGALMVLGSIAVFVRLGLYRAVIRYVSIRALAVVLFGVLISVAWLVVLIWLFDVSVPVVAVVNYGLIALLLVGGSRLAMREMYHRMVSRAKQRVLIYGAGSAGRQLAQALMNGEQFHPVLFVDDDETLQRSTVMGIRVIDPDKVPEAVKKNKVERILLALPSATRSVRKEILESLEHLNVKVQTVPGMADMVTGELAIDALQDVRIEDLLGRDPVEPEPALMQQHIRGKVVLVTGAGGSIGSELCRQIVAQKPAALVLYELSEFALYSIDEELKKICKRLKVSVPVYPIIGTVQRRNRIETVLKTFKVQTVYHAAAYKHVPLVEFNMVEGVRNNVFGTWHTAEAAITAGVEQFVLISTDKAVRPTNVMGTTKRLSELVLQALAKREQSTRFCMVRFGNVLGSSGSVVPVFKKQIEEGGPVTVTHPAITRYFMTIPEAAQLVIQAGTMGDSGDVFVLDMGEPVKIVDLAKKMIHLSGLDVKTEENPHGDIEIVYTGLRPGEKLYEELLIGDNVVECAHPRICRAEEDFWEWQRMSELLTEIDDACQYFKIDKLRELLLSSPAGYEPTEDGVNDLIWNKQ
ncbi:nucleoside-diphosphate sugar epimerase/dehydratase [Pseudidiomarina sp.]|uniref:nucleoside-diphosphate sugar epimerase/dehydratase n=1 Tax=Pseudidiomarina sp. TaxID=2081707 RepID=UPI00299CFFFD|nr:nucleoside-diphosphate sugar epimerase/dehydratase [Pseudidiomarina sp.]MDX1706795.1 nucleoside-diphosphate sugar epimerase/dehydratase [Pseudidiomarina sp.]